MTAHLLRESYLCLLATVLYQVCDGLSLADSCDLSNKDGLCSGHDDDTAALQAALSDCPRSGLQVTIRNGARCVSQPLVLHSHTVLILEANTSIKAGAKWSDTSSVCDGVRPFISAANSTNITIRGAGTIDGAGAQWWPTGPSIFDKPRPRLMVFRNASFVHLEGFTLLNAAFWTLLLGGQDFTVLGVTVRAPNFQHARNTDGIDVAAHRVHIYGVDIANGDDSICIKSPSSDVLVEHSIVSAGNGLVIGTAGSGLGGDDPNVADVSNVTFRHCIVNDTTFGCHIKYHYPQKGKVSNVLFENITIMQSAEATARRTTNGDWAGYALGIHQSDQGRSLESSASGFPTMVEIKNVTYRNIRADVLHAGQFRCGGWWSPACNSISLSNVHINASVDGCSFQHAQGSAQDVTPSSCTPPSHAVVV